MCAGVGSAQDRFLPGSGSGYRCSGCSHNKEKESFSRDGVTGEWGLDKSAEMNASLPHPMVTPRAHRAPPLPSAHVALGQGSRWRWLFPSTHPRPLSSRGLPSASSPPHPGRGFGQGLLRLGGVLPLPPPSLASLISSRGVSWLWPPSRAAPDSAALLHFCCYLRLPPSRDCFNFHLSAACGRTD